METKLTLFERDQKLIAQNFRTNTALLQGGAPRGQSAYEQAVEGGYEGTKAEFEEALATGITTISTNIADVNTVATNISDVETVAANISDVHTVAENISDVNTVASISSDVSDVADNATDITTVASISSAVQNVAGNESNVTLVADNLSNVNTVASNMNSVLATAADIANVNIVAGDKTNIDTVAGISSDVSTVAGIYQDVSTVAEVSTDVSTVASNVSDVSTVATNISNVNSAVSNMAAIIAAPTAATNAANSATNAQKWAEGLDSDVTPLGGTHSAKGWANRAEQIVASLGPVMKYKGTVATYNDLPSTGQEIGDTYNILDTGENYAWDGSDWDALSSTVDLSAYRTSAAQDVIDAGKADKTNKVNGIPISTANAYYYAESTSAADAVEKTVSIPAITELNAGQVIIVKPTITSTVASSTLKLNSFTAYPMLYAGATITTSTDSKVWSANTPSIFVFDGSYWRFAGHGADDNTTYTLNYLIVAGTANAGTGNYAITRYGLLMQKLDGTWETLKETSTNYNTGTTKTVNTNGFIPGKILYYNSTTVKKNGEALTASTLYLKAATVDARYSFNCGATPGWAIGDSIYVVGTIGTDGLFYLDTTTWWSNALPTTQDGKVYMYIGTYVSDAYKISLDLDHPMYYHDGTSVKQYVVAGNKLDASAASNFVDKTTADQAITSQKIVRNNWIVNALYVLAGINAWSWYKALSWTGSRIRVGDSSNIGLQLETNESNIKAKIGATDTNVITALDTMTGATGSVAGTSGLVPVPAATDNNKFLKGDGTWATAGGGSSRNVGEIVESTVPLTDAGLHLLDGSLLSGSGSYADFVTHMAGVYADHSELFTTEADWQTSVTNYGVCGKFVYDSVNNTVRLPKKSSTERHLIYHTQTGNAWCDVYSDGWCEQGNISNVASAGATISLVRSFVDTDYNVVTSGHSAKYGNTTAYDYTASDFKAWTSDDESFNAGELSWVAFGYTDISDLGSETIYSYIVIANSTKTQIEVDIDEIAADLNGKVDKSDLDEIQCVVETYKSGNAWYRVYSDGWCEQGSYVNDGTENGSFVADLVKPFATTDYTVFITFDRTGSSTANMWGMVHNNSTSQFQVVKMGHSFWFYACGYVS